MSIEPRRAKKFGFVIFAIFVSVFVARQSLAAGFLSVAPNFPIMDGLVENKKAAMVFDKPDGRIVHADLTGTMAATAIVDFYQTTLPQLGWSEVVMPSNEETILAYARENERLTIVVETVATNEVSVRVAIVPN